MSGFSELRRKIGTVLVDPRNFDAVRQEPPVSLSNTCDAGEVRLTLIGPMPPPIHGQSMVMEYMASELAQHFPQIRIADTCEGDARGLRRGIVIVRRSASSWRAIRGSDAVYIAVKADRGMWLTTALAGLARLAGARVFLHHHSYAYVRTRKRRMVALTRAAGSNAHHIVLSHSMASDLRRAVPEIRRTVVLGNAGFIDRTLLELPLKADSPDLVLGHLSNLSPEKGLGEVVDLAVGLQRAGVSVQLIIGGPTVHDESLGHLDRAAREMGDRFEYRGLLTGQSKRRFFEEITHFVFPSRYVHEAVPLVLYEAMSAGALCVTTRQGSIPEQLQTSPAILAQSTVSFVEETLPALVGTRVSATTSDESRQAYCRALDDSQRQLAALVETIARRP